jgi:hypothetical protein
MTCVANAAENQGGGLPNPEVSHTYTGTNGTFADSCDINGNLNDYRCETMPPPCGPGPNGCWGPEVETGRVIALPTIDCAGTCRAARCDDRCPQQGDQITFEGLDADGREIVRNDTDGRSYTCTVDPSNARGSNFGCAKAPAGQTGFVQGLGLTDYCTGSALGSIGVVLDGVPTAPGPYTCSFSCGIHPTSNCGF